MPGDVLSGDPFRDFQSRRRRCDIARGGRGDGRFPSGKKGQAGAVGEGAGMRKRELPGGRGESAGRRPGAWRGVLFGLVAAGCVFTP
ncbi:MAG: hypothetical protein FJX77_07225, partial [Armatimonadetes bacterium]|nr:hypothetical protein [Armatimonadota bacterium]